MKVLDAEFVQGFIRMANDGWEQGWHERNGGNLSYRIRPEEVEAVNEIVRFDRACSGCTYLDIDTSPNSVGVIKLSDYL